ncbi:MAG: hypothetical protein JWN32_1131 [Solirubrobacterales bacterium]|nr:hypothetical protein [Solirubrobacterales bacterium]
MRVHRILAFAALATTAVVAGASAEPAGAAVTAATSTNWAGYVASKSGVRFRRAAGFWTVPSATCSTGAPTYSAVWIGLGGYHSGSKGLEQIGTESDCRSNGSARYTAWYELVPDAAHSAGITVRPGDRMSASVLVSGHTVRLRMVDLTRNRSVTKRLTASAIDVTSADWIVEAPSACTSATSCRTLPLANFSPVTFAGAQSTSTGGHTGKIADSAWSAVALSLVAGGPQSGRPGFIGGPGAVSRAFGQATPGALAATGDGFDVQFSQTAAAARSR